MKREIIGKALTRHALIYSQRFKTLTIFFTGKDFTKLDAARSIILNNIQCGDSLKFMQDLTNPQQSLF